MLSLTPSARRTLYHLFLATCFGLGVYFNQYDVFYPEPFILMAFAGAIGILVEYALRVRSESPMWVIPALLAVELTASLVSKAGFSGLAFALYIPGALLFLVYGILFIRSAIRNRSAGMGIFPKFLVLGISSAFISAWELVTYFPFTFDKSHLGWRILYLFVMAWLLLVDFTTRLDQLPGMKVEKQILRISLLVISAMYFERFIFQ